MATTRTASPRTVTRRRARLRWRRSPRVGGGNNAAKQCTYAREPVAAAPCCVTRCARGLVLHPSSTQDTRPMSGPGSACIRKAPASVCYDRGLALALSGSTGADAGGLQQRQNTYRTIARGAAAGHRERNHFTGIAMRIPTRSRQQSMRRGKLDVVKDCARLLVPPVS
jgi:hypothetical protein